MFSRIPLEAGIGGVLLLESRPEMTVINTGVVVVEVAGNDQRLHFILKGEPRISPGGLSVKCKRRARNNFKIFGLRKME